MLIDLEGSRPEPKYTSDVCILGAGVAGLILATRLAALGLKVDLLEAGGLSLEPRSQELYRAEMAGAAHAGTTEGRFRVFGGSTTRWGGQLLPYTEDIFRPGSCIPSAGWPIGPETIERYYPEVLRIMGIGPRAASLPFDGAGLLSQLGYGPVPFGEEIRLRFSKWAPFRKRNLADSLGRTVLGSANVRVFLHANALAIETSGGIASAVHATNYSGREVRYLAGKFAVCLGTIESSRLLLSSALPDPHGQLGRYFHDHVGVRVAELSGTAREQVVSRLGPFFVENSLHTCKLEAAPPLRERECLPAAMAHFVIEEPEDSGVGAVRGMLRALQRRDLRAALATSRPILRGIGDVARLLYGSRVLGRRSLTARSRIFLHIDMEQVASSTDCIRLSDRTDLLGQRLAVVDWRAGDPERFLTQRYASVVREQLERAGFAPADWNPGALSGDPSSLTLTDTYHPMGGLRLGTDPFTSVVNPDLGVHAVPNLHVASCAVYPSGGSSNPTFTLMALTLRLADHLAGLGS